MFLLVAKLLAWRVQEPPWSYAPVAPWKTIVNDSLQVRSYIARFLAACKAEWKNFLIECDGAR
jgi:hypothetical protein